MKFDKLPRFSNWAAWNERDSLKDLSHPGIYALAISRKHLSGKAFDWSVEIAYFGMTNSQAGLKGRLKQFDNVAIGKKGHGGAERFMHNFKNKEELAPHLYVAVWSFPCDVKASTPTDLVVMGRVAKAEYECFAKYVELYGKLPKYNDKKNSPKLKV